MLSECNVVEIRSPGPIAKGHVEMRGLMCCYCSATIFAEGHKRVAEYLPTLGGEPERDPDPFIEDDDETTAEAPPS